MELTKGYTSRQPQPFISRQNPNPNSKNRGKIPNLDLHHSSLSPPFLSLSHRLTLTQSAMDLSDEVRATHKRTFLKFFEQTVSIFSFFSFFACFILD